MKLDLDKYAVHRLPIQIWYKENTGYESLSVALAMWAATTHCNIVSLAFFIGEDIGYTPEIVDLIDRLTKFYGYTEIAGQKEGSPFLTYKK